MTQRIEREIASLGFEIEVVLVWRKAGAIADERRGFKRWERTKSRRLGDRGHDFVALYAYDPTQRDWRHVWKSDWPTHFVQDGPPVPAPNIPRPSLEQPENLPDRLADIERRVVRAFQVDRALPDQEKGWLKVKAYALITRPGPGDYPPEQVTRDRPKPAEVTDYLVIMPLVAKLGGDDIRLLRLRSFGLSFRSIADRINAHEHTARKQFRDALLRLDALAARVDATAVRPGA
jgi:hypothetical protein